MIENPVTGEQIRFLKRAADTEGGYLQFELFLKPGGYVPFEHVHKRQEEIVSVVAGDVRVRIAERERVLQAGEFASIPAGVAHTFRNDAQREAHLIIEFRPALKTEELFETIFGLARDGKMSRRGKISPLQGVLLALEHDTYLPRPPLALQRVVGTLLAPIATLLGYRSRYSQYSDLNSRR
jgi:quercetin dioxygenase-like cupin family protein